MVRFFVCSVLLSIVLTSCDLRQIVGPENTMGSVAEYKNPHIICTRCHATEKPQSDGTLFSPGTDPSSLCIKCHKDYIESHHPVDFIPADQFNSQFPLFGGKVRCLTCHEIHGGPRHEGTLRLLRGGPYEDQRRICFKCHSAKKYAAFNPHKMLDDEGNVKIVNGEPVCLGCHSKKPDPAVDQTEDVRFRADVGFLCWRCHPPMPGIFFKQHFLAKPSAQDMKLYRESEGRLTLILPLVPRGRITCSTCHNPHQKGVIQREAAAKGADTIKKLRSPSICFACHRM